MKCKACGKKVTRLESYNWYDEKGRISALCDDCYELGMNEDPIPFEVVRPKVYSVDLDNTLTVGSAWTVDECENIEPREDAIRKINEIAEKNFVIIHTARRYTLARATMEWLDRNGVKYHAVRFGKMPCDVIFDLDAVNRVEDL